MAVTSDKQWTRLLMRNVRKHTGTGSRTDSSSGVPIYHHKWDALRYRLLVEWPDRNLGGSADLAEALFEETSSLVESGRVPEDLQPPLTEIRDTARTRALRMARNRVVYS